MRNSSARQCYWLTLWVSRVLPANHPPRRHLGHAHGLDCVLERDAEVAGTIGPQLEVKVPTRQEEAHGARMRRGLDWPLVPMSNYRVGLYSM